MNEEKLPQSYEKFALVAKNMRADPAKVELLGSGSESNVYRLQVDDQSYAAKFARLYFHK